MPKQVKITEAVYARLKALSERSDRSMASLVGDLVKLSHKKEMKTMGEEKDIATCDECEEEIPKDASFCPYCGVEFEEGEEEEEEESEEED